MKWLHLLLITVILFTAGQAIATIQPDATQPWSTSGRIGTSIYKVNSGDTLGAIATYFHTTVPALATLNDIADPNVITVGENLLVPTPVNHLPIGSEALVCTLTAYTDGFASTGKNPGEPGYGITSTGQKALQGLTVAVDPSVIPYGTPLFIPGIGIRIAEDTGGAIVGNHIDVFYNSDQTAIDFGVKRNAIVYLMPRSAVTLVRNQPVLNDLTRNPSPQALVARIPRNTKDAKTIFTPAATNRGLPASLPTTLPASLPARPTAVTTSQPQMAATMALSYRRLDVLDVWDVLVDRLVWQPMLEATKQAL